MSELNLQRVLAGVTVLQDDIEDLQVVDGIAGGAIGTSDRCVLTEGECAEDRGDDSRVGGTRCWSSVSE